MKTVVVGDIHGCYNELKGLIEDLVLSGQYDKETDKLIFLGDYIDRGKDSRLVIEFIRNLQNDNNNVIALMGNHEDMLLNYYKGLDNWWTWNGYQTTLESYAGYDGLLKEDIKWIKNLPLYHEDEHFVYVHAGVDVDKTLEEQDKHTLLWTREPFIYADKEYHKRVIFGHTPTVNLIGEYKPVCTDTNNIDIDTACVYGGNLTALIIEDGKIQGFYQVRKEETETESELNV